MPPIAIALARPPAKVMGAVSKSAGLSPRVNEGSSVAKEPDAAAGAAGLEIPGGERVAFGESKP